MIILVEDEFLIRALMADVLADAGFNVLEAAHADEAIALVMAHAADVKLVFTDVHMPGKMDGLGLVHHVYKNWPDIGLLVASGRARLDTDDLPPGCHFLPKPYDLHATVDRVRQLAGR